MFAGTPASPDDKHKMRMRKMTTMMVMMTRMRMVTTKVFHNVLGH